MKVLKYIIDSVTKARIPGSARLGAYHNQHYIDGKTPRYEYENAKWSWNGSRRKLISEAAGNLYVPRAYRVKTVEGVMTILPAYQESGVAKCWWLESSLGYSYKIVPGYYDFKTKTHATNLKQLNTLVRKKRIADIQAKRRARAEKMDKAEFQRRAMNSSRTVHLLKDSYAVGNCKVGTKNFLTNLGIEKQNRKTRLAAIYRLAVKKKQNENYAFRRAIALHV